MSKEVSERPSKPDEHLSAEEQLELASEGRMKNAVEQLLESPDASGMEEENIVLDAEQETLSRDQQEKIMNKLAEQPNTEVERKSITGDTVTKVVYNEREGVDGVNAWIEFDMGTSEIEKVTAPHEDLDRSLEDLEFLDEKIYRALNKAAEEDPSLEGASMYQVGHTPTLMRGDQPSGETVEKIRYAQHEDYWLDEDGESVIDWVIETASLQLSAQGQIEHYFEDIPEENLEEFLETGEHSEEVVQAFDEYIRDFHGGGEFPGMQRLAELILYDERNSAEVEDGEVKQVAARNDHYNKMNDGKPAEDDRQKHFDFPEMDDVKDNHDLTLLNADFPLEFGPEAEAQHLYSTETGLPLHMHFEQKYGEEIDPEDAVITNFSNREGEKKSLKELLEEREAVGTAKFEHDGEIYSEEIVMDIDELIGLHRDGVEMTDDEKEFVNTMYAMATSGAWANYRMRDGSGASFESRLPPATPRRKDSAYQQKAALARSHDLQKHFAENLGVNHISHQEWQEIQDGITSERGDYTVPFEVEGRDGRTYSDVTVEELKYGSDRVEGFIDILEEGVAETVGQEEAEEWRYRKENQQPMYEEFEKLFEEEGLEDAIEYFRLKSPGEKEDIEVGNEYS